MKKILAVSIVITIVMVISCGFIDKHKDNNQSEVTKEIVPGNVLVNQNNGKIQAFGLPNNDELKKNKLMYVVVGNYNRSVPLSKLKKAKEIGDIFPSYPTNWIQNYISVEIEAFNNGKKEKVVGTNNTLTKEQKDLFSNVDLASDVVVKVNYKTKNAATDKLESRVMKVSLTVIPEVEAEFVGGEEKMEAYLRAKSYDKVINKHKNLDWLQLSIITFTIDEKGEINNVKILSRTGDMEIDDYLVELIRNMPQWNSAKNLKGEAVKQDLVFKFGESWC